MWDKVTELLAEELTVTVTVPWFPWCSASTSQPSLRNTKVSWGNKTSSERSLWTEITLVKNLKQNKLTKYFKICQRIHLDMLRGCMVIYIHLLHCGKWGTVLPKITQSLALTWELLDWIHSTTEDVFQTWGTQELLFINNFGSFQMEGFKGLLQGFVCCKTQENFWAN